MKHFITLLFTLLIIPLSYGQRVKVGDLYYNLDSSKSTAEVTYEYYWSSSNYNYVKGNLAIAQKVEYNGRTYAVTSIGDYAFADCKGLTSVTIPNSVTKISDHAFSWCSGLTSVTIPNSVISIERYAFLSCSGLTSVTIPNSVTSIGESAFDHCSGLTSVTIPNSVTSIGQTAFLFCRSLIAVTIPNSVTFIGYNAFGDCSGLIDITVDSNNPSYSSLNGILYSKKLDKLIRCPGGKNGSVTIPSSVIFISDLAFGDCIGVTSVTIPNSVTTIGEWAFNNCSSLQSVTIPNSVTSIESGAFRDCSGLKEITFNSNGELSLRKEAFEYCSNLQVITCNTQRPPVADSFDVFDDQVYSKAKLYVPQSQLSLYSTTTPWSKFSNILGKEQYTEVEIRYSGSTTMTAGQTLQLTLSPKGKPDITLDAEWSSSNSAVAPVSSSGLVTAKSVGTAKITAKYGSLSATCSITVNESKIEATHITLNKTSWELEIGSTGQLTATVSPSNATNKTITWSSSNSSVASVSNSGLITAKSAGTATITAKCGSVSASCQVTVIKQQEVVQPFDITEDFKILDSGLATGSDNAPVNPKQYTSSKTGIKYTMMGCYINDKSYPHFLFINGKNYKGAYISFTLDANCSQIQLHTSSIGSTNENSTVNFYANGNLVGNYKVNKQDYTYTIDIPTKYQQAGTIYRIESGTDMYNQQFYWFTYKCQGASKIEADKVTLNKTSWELEVGSTGQLTASVSPSNATDKNITWSSSNSSVASVSNTGLITARTVGTAVITAKCGSVSATCNVTVVNDSGVEQIPEEERDKISIFTVNGILLHQNVKADKVKELSKGIYLIITETGKSYKIVI